MTATELDDTAPLGWESVRERLGSFSEVIEFALQSFDGDSNDKVRL
jgi:hypothetical protein